MKKKYLIEIEDITNSHVPIESLPKEASSHCEESNQFMIHMYDQMFSTIDRSYKNIWEMILAIGGGIGVLQLGTQQFFDVAVIGYVIGLFWILIRLIDTNHWCNRNLFIIHGIENHFLDNDANKLFRGFRPNKREKYNVCHFSIKIQIYFVCIIIFLSVSSYIIYKCNFLHNKQYIVDFLISCILIGSLLAIIISFCIYNNRKNKFQELAKTFHYNSTERDSKRDVLHLNRIKHFGFKYAGTVHYPSLKFEPIILNPQGRILWAMVQNDEVKAIGFILEDYKLFSRIRTAITAKPDNTNYGEKFPKYISDDFDVYVYDLPDSIKTKSDAEKLKDEIKDGKLLEWEIAR